MLAHKCVDCTAVGRDVPSAPKMQTGLRVLHVIPSIGPLRGGPSEVVRMMAEGLALRGVDVHVATTDDNGPNQRLSVPHGAPVVDSGVTYWYFERQIRPYICSLPLTLWLFSHVRDFDLLHIHAVFSYPSTAAALIARARGIPYIIRPLGVLNRWGIEQRRRRAKRLSLALIEQPILRHAAAVHYTSRQEKMEAETLDSWPNPAVLPNPVRLPEAISRSTQRASFALRNPVVLFMSRLDRKKGLDLLIQAFARVRTRFPKSLLVIAGSGEAEFENSLRMLAANNLEPGAVQWAGFVSGAEKKKLLESADLFVLPSYSENFGVAVAEAMAAGLPVIVSDQVGIHEWISDEGAGLVTPCDSDSVSSAILHLLENPTTGVEMGCRGKILALSRFSIPAISEGLLSLYRSVLNTNNYDS